jgi:hypothetical protein
LNYFCVRKSWRKARGGQVLIQFNPAKDFRNHIGAIAVRQESPARRRFRFSQKVFSDTLVAPPRRIKNKNEKQITEP